ncbi:MAG TPA: hypothetical protein GXX55_06810 [Firmicutes bacterium]|nr:hypothetical protein [Bacillota bacterium]
MGTIVVSAADIRVGLQTPWDWDIELPPAWQTLPGAKPDLMLTVKVSPQPSQVAVDERYMHYLAERYERLLGSNIRPEAREECLRRLISNMLCHFGANGFSPWMDRVILARDTSFFAIGDTCVFVPHRCEEGEAYVGPTSYMQMFYGDSRPLIPLALFAAGFDGRFLCIHGAGVVDAKGCYVFYGPSGAGKSTVCKLSAGMQVLSDELVVIRSSSDCMMATASPWVRSSCWYAAQQNWYPIRALVSLKKAERTRLVPLSPTAALVQVATCMFEIAYNVVSDLNLHKRAFENACRLVKATSCWQLEFTRDGTIWDEIRRVLP